MMPFILSISGGEAGLAKAFGDQSEVVSEILDKFRGEGWPSDWTPEEQETQTDRIVLPLENIQKVLDNMFTQQELTLRRERRTERQERVDAGEQEADPDAADSGKKEKIFQKKEK